MQLPLTMQLFPDVCTLKSESLPLRTRNKNFSPNPLRYKRHQFLPLVDKAHVKETPPA